MAASRRDRRTEIMRAAEKLFTSRRYHEISLDDVVQKAHVGKGTVYRYFTSKDDLFFQTATSGFDELCTLLGRVPEGGAFRERLLEACRDIHGFYTRRRQLFRMMQSEEARMYWRSGAGRERWMEQRRRLVSAVAGIIRHGVEAGELRSDIPAETLASFLLGLLRTRARDGEETSQEWGDMETVVDLFRHGAAGRNGQGERTGYDGVHGQA